MHNTFSFSVEFRTRSARGRTELRQLPRTPELSRIFIITLFIIERSFNTAIEFIFSTTTRCQFRCFAEKCHTRDDILVAPWHEIGERNSSFMYEHDLNRCFATALWTELNLKKGLCIIPAIQSALLISYFVFI